MAGTDIHTIRLIERYLGQEQTAELLLDRAKAGAHSRCEHDTLMAATTAEAPIRSEFY
jgi:hypothetical protein